LIKSEIKRKSAAKVNAFLKQVAAQSTADANQMVKSMVTQSATTKRAPVVRPPFSNLNGTVQSATRPPAVVVSNVNKSYVGGASLQHRPLPPLTPSVAKKTIDERHLKSSGMLSQAKVLDKAVSRAIANVRTLKMGAEQK
jgi:hypothetical protein